MPRSMSNSATLRQILKGLNQWRKSSLVGEKWWRISVVSTTCKGKWFIFVFFCWWHARERGPGHTCEFESTHVRKNWINPFCTCMAGLIDVLQLKLEVNTRKQSAGINSPVLYGNRSQTGTQHRASAWRNKFRTKNYYRAHICKWFSATCVTPPSPPSISIRARASWTWTRKTPYP